MLRGRRNQELFNGFSFSFARQKSSGDWVHDDVNILNVELYTENE